MTEAILINTKPTVTFETTEWSPELRQSSSSAPEACVLLCSDCVYYWLVPSRNNVLPSWVIRTCCGHPAAVKLHRRMQPSQQKCSRFSWSVVDTLFIDLQTEDGRLLCLDRSRDDTALSFLLDSTLVELTFPKLSSTQRIFKNLQKHPCRNFCQWSLINRPCEMCVRVNEEVHRNPLWVQRSNRKTGRWLKWNHCPRGCSCQCDETIRREALLLSCFTPALLPFPDLFFPLNITYVPPIDSLFHRWLIGPERSKIVSPSCLVSLVSRFYFRLWFLSDPCSQDPDTPRRPRHKPCFVLSLTATCLENVAFHSFPPSKETTKHAWIN